LRVAPGKVKCAARSQGVRRVASRKLAQYRIADITAVVGAHVPQVRRLGDPAEHAPLAMILR